MKKRFRPFGFWLFFSLLISTVAASEKPYAPTSFEVFYQPTYTMATGGPTSQLGSAGAGIRIGYAMTPKVAFELGGYYDGYVFGDIAGANQTAYAARATGDFAVAPTPNTRVYAGMDANAYFNPPSVLTSTGNKDLGAIVGFRTLTGTGTMKFLVGAEYRYAASTAFTYSGGSINPTAVIGTVGFHFGGL